MNVFKHILKEIFTFANILVQAHGETVSLWNEKSLQSALNWAEYCKKVDTLL